MTAYDLMLKRNSIENKIEFCKQCLENDIGTALLTNDDVEELKSSLNEAKYLIDTLMSGCEVKI